MDTAAIYLPYQKRQLYIWSDYEEVTALEQIAVRCGCLVLAFVPTSWMQMTRAVQVATELSLLAIG
jgi:hypothetical protein